MIKISMAARTWKQLNSPIVVWFFGTVVVGLAAFIFEHYTDNRDRSRLLQDRYDRLGFEYAGRLSQYSEWFVYLLENPNVLNQRLHKCVTPSLLKISIRNLATNMPSSQTTQLYSPHSPCDVQFSYGAIYSDYENRSTISLLAEMRLIHDEMKSRGEGRISDSAIIGCEYSKISSSERLTIAINGFLNPDAVIQPNIKELNAPISVEELRKNYMCAFYGIGPQELWYTDVFAG